MGGNLGINKDAVKKSLTDGIVDEVKSSVGGLTSFVTGGDSMLQKVCDWISNFISGLFGNSDGKTIDTDPAKENKTTTSQQQQDSKQQTMQHDHPAVVTPNVPNLKAAVKQK